MHKDYEFTPPLSPQTEPRLSLGDKVTAMLAAAGAAIIFCYAFGAVLNLAESL